MPSGGAFLAAAAVLLASGHGQRVAGVLGTRRRVLFVWIGLTLALSAVNLPLDRGAVLLNVGGTVVPAAFTAFLLSGPWARRARLRVVLGALLGAVPLATVTAWGEMAAVGWPATMAAGLAAAAIVGVLGRNAAERLTALAGAFALSAGVWALASASGWLAWPAALGGGPAFDAGVLAWLSGQVANEATASGTPGRQPAADSPAP